MVLILFVLATLQLNAFNRPSGFKFLGSSKQEQLPDCSVVGDDRLGCFILKSKKEGGGIVRKWILFVLLLFVWKIFLVCGLIWLELPKVFQLFTAASFPKW